MSTTLTEQGARRKDERLNVRLSANVKHLVEQAAALSGQSLTDFASDALESAAGRVVNDARALRLSNDDFDRFVASLDTDTKPNDAFLRAAERYRRNPV